MLVIFDVDGTLTDTDAVDAGVFEGAFRSVFGVALPTTDWSEYPCPSDQGVAEEAVRRLGLDAGRIPELRRRFVDLLRAELERRGAEPVPGAGSVLERLEAAGCDAALATGAWQDSARAKLAAAGVRIAGRVLVGSDFHAAREQILQEARRRSRAAERAVYVGDGLWDLRAARALGLPFVGVDARGTGTLRRAGVRHVVGDYRDPARFLSALREAEVP